MIKSLLPQGGGSGGLPGIPGSIGSIGSKVVGIAKKVAPYVGPVLQSVGGFLGAGGNNEDPYGFTRTTGQTFNTGASSTVGNTSGSGTSTQTPSIQPEFGGLQQMLINQAMQRLEGGPDVITGLRGAGLRDINRGADLAQQSLENKLTSAGLGGTGVHGSGLAGLETARMGDTNRFLTESIPQLERNFQSQDLADALSVFGYRLPGSTTEQNFTGQNSSQEQTAEAGTSGSTVTNITAPSWRDYFDRLNNVNANPQLFDQQVGPPPMPQFGAGPEGAGAGGSTGGTAPTWGTGAVVGGGSGAPSYGSGTQRPTYGPGGGVPQLPQPELPSISRRAYGGAAAGASTGALAGSVIPGVGTAIGAGVGALVGGVGSMFGRGRREANAIVPTQNYITQEAGRINDSLWQQQQAGTLTPQDIADAQSYLGGLREQFFSQTRDFKRAGPGARQSLSWIDQMLGDWGTIPVGGR